MRLRSVAVAVRSCVSKGASVHPLNSRPVIRLITALVLFAAPCLPASELGPEGVSPGAPDRVAPSHASCPTFSWEAIPDVELYELVVYRITDELLAIETVDLTTAVEVLYTTVPGRASAWTPEAFDCFTPGERYVWFVRAVMDAEGARSSEWSEPRFFEVAAAPSAEELERAIEVIRRWDAANGDGSLILSSDAVAGAVPVAAAVSDADSDTDSDAGSAAPKSVITGTAAIRGEQPDFSGETYGVVGINASPDGAGIGASNVTGGPDLVLDGAVPAEFTEAGVDRSSASPQTFSVTNTGGGGMTLDIGGAEVLTTASSIDADTLDGIDGADFATDAEAAALVATHAASADHDGRYYTETELGTSGAGGSVHWDNLGGVPPGFADGVDDDTIYSFGPGLVLDNGQIRLDSAAFVQKASTIDTVGTDPSIAIGSDGLGLIAYHDQINVNLKVAHCDNILCTSATLSTIDSTGDVGRYTSIAIGSDGLGLISYYDIATGDLKVAHCDNVLCTSATLSTIDSAGSVAWYTSIAIGSDGLGLIAYYDNYGIANSSLKVAHCNDVACTSATISTLLGPGTDLEASTSIAIGGDGLGLISFALGIGPFSAHCDNVLCSSADIANHDGGTLVVGRTSMVIGPDGLGLYSYCTSSDFLRTAHCIDPSCTAADFSTHESGCMDTSMAISPGDDLGTVYLPGPSGLRAAHCADVTCTWTDTVTDLLCPGFQPSVAIGVDGVPLVACSGLAVVHLPYGY